MNKFIFFKIISLTCLSLSVLLLAVFYVMADWQEPDFSPSDENISTPINTGDEAQAKAGIFSATEFYDYDDSSFYLNPDADSILSSLTIVGGTELPAYERAKIYFGRGESGKRDGLYFGSQTGWIYMHKTLIGPDTSTTKVGDAYEGISYHVGVGQFTALAYSTDSFWPYNSGWRPISSDAASLTRFCEERGQLYLDSWFFSFYGGDPAYSSPIFLYYGCERTSYWSGTSWEGSYNSSCTPYYGWVWCGEPE